MATSRHLDGVQETTNTVGNGDRVLAGAKLGYRSVAAAGAVDGDILPFAIRGGAEWEAGLYRYNSSANSLTPVQITASSNAGAKVAFSAGSKDVFCGPLADHIPWALGAIPETINSGGGGLLLRLNMLKSALVLSSKSYVQKINDISGAGNHSDLNTTNPPKLVHYAMNGLPGMFFNGAHRHTFSTIPGIGSPLAMTVWGIGTAWGAPSGNSHCYNYKGNPIGFDTITSLGYMYNGTLPANHPEAQSIAQDHRPDGLLAHAMFFIHIYNGAASINNVHGSRQTGFNPGTGATGTTNYFTIGSDASGGISAGAASWNRMILHEFGLVNRAISATEETQLAIALRALGRMYSP